jgi:hypothetical protein
VAVDASGNIYIANNELLDLTINTFNQFNYSLTKTIGGSFLPYPWGVVVDGGFIYVTSLQTTIGGDQPASVIVFSQSANEYAAPIATITGLNTALNTPVGIALIKPGVPGCATIFLNFILTFLRSVSASRNQ